LRLWLRQLHARRLGGALLGLHCAALLLDLFTALLHIALLKLALLHLTLLELALLSIPLRQLAWLHVTRLLRTQGQVVATPLRLLSDGALRQWRCAWRGRLGCARLRSRVGSALWTVAANRQLRAAPAHTGLGRARLAPQLAMRRAHWRGRQHGGEVTTPRRTR
jgi:hypothetical protein